MSCGIGICHKKSEVNIGTLFRSAWQLGASFIFTVGRRYKKQSSDTVNAVMKMPYYDYTDIEHLYSNLP